MRNGNGEKVSVIWTGDYNNLILQLDFSRRKPICWPCIQLSRFLIGFFKYVYMTKTPDRENNTVTAEWLGERRDNYE